MSDFCARVAEQSDKEKERSSMMHAGVPNYIRPFSCHCCGLGIHLRLSQSTNPIFSISTLSLSLSINAIPFVENLEISTISGSSGLQNSSFVSGMSTGMGCYMAEPQKARIYHYYVPVFLWCEQQITEHQSKFKDGEDIPPLVDVSSKAIINRAELSSNYRTSSGSDMTLSSSDDRVFTITGIPIPGRATKFPCSLTQPFNTVPNPPSPRTFLDSKFLVANFRSLKVNLRREEASIIFWFKLVDKDPFDLLVDEVL
ncbi:hypothetical protein JHK82_035469 [Glycine max]|nr:hypothetical protein JHK82_035469 [Glycine max]